MADLTFVEQVASDDQHLAVVAVARNNGAVHTSVVNAGVIVDPVDGTPGVGLVADGRTTKLRLLRVTGQATVTFKAGFTWVAVAGPVRLVGPDDGEEQGLDVAATIRSVFKAAGGHHEDWDEFDRVMAQDRRCAVFVRADRIVSNR